jgi:TonB family protein
LALLSLWHAASPPEPLIHLEDAIQVDLIIAPAGGAAPKRASRLPDKETHRTVEPAEPDEPAAPLEPPKKETAKEPEKPKEPDPKPVKSEPPREAKSLEDALKKDPKPAVTPPPEPGLDDEARERMAQILARNKTRGLVAKLSGAEGPRDRSASDTTSQGGSGGSGAASGSGDCNKDRPWCTALHDAVSAQWRPSPYLQKKAELLVRVLVKMDAEGTITSVTVSRSSGDSTFDSYAVYAVSKLKQLPMPSHPSLRTAILLDGIEFEFNPKGIAK